MMKKNITKIFMFSLFKILVIVLSFCKVGMHTTKVYAFESKGKRQSYLHSKVSMGIPERIKITGFSDLHAIYEHSNALNDIVLHNTLCVATNSGTGNFKFNISGSGEDGQFNLTNISNSEIVPYNVSWNGESVLANSYGLSDNSILFSESCLSNNTNNLEITILSENLELAQNDTYYGDLTVFVEPE